MSISVQHITKIYGKQTAVNDVSFSIPKGQTCGFLGPNGAGKSTTLKMITGYLKPDAGKILINDIDVAKYPIEAKQQIGYLAEHNPLYKTMYVREFLRFVAKIHHVNNVKQRVSETIEQTGLQKEAHKQIGQLSKGYQQRVGLAQALIHNPSVLILDEPLSGLDPSQLGELRELVKELGKEKTLIFSSHILQEVEQVANRIIMIREGNLVLDQEQEALATENTFTVLEFEEALSQELKEKLNVVANYQEIEQKIHLVGSSASLRKQAFQFAVENNLTLLRLEEKKKNLTDLFIQKAK